MAQYTTLIAVMGLHLEYALCTSNNDMPDVRKTNKRHNIITKVLQLELKPT
jgi:hypothetical protein